MGSSAIESAVLVHGAGGGGWEWNVWKGVFAAAGLHAVAPDLVPVAAGLPATGLEAYEAQVRWALQPLPGPRVLVGASLGGLLALRCAQAAQALVLVNPLPPAPWGKALPAREWTDVVPWRRTARLQGTRRTLADSDDATALFAFRHWRDESGRALREAQHAQVQRPAGKVLCIASTEDEDVPASLTRAMAAEWGATCWEVEGGHVSPLLGRDSASLAGRVVEWLSAA